MKFFPGRKLDPLYSKTLAFALRRREEKERKRDLERDWKERGKRETKRER